MQFAPEKDPTAIPKNGSGTNGRGGGCGTKYGPGGPGSVSTGSNAGPSGTTKGPAGTRISGFHGDVKGANPKGGAWTGGARGGSNPMKR